MHFQSLTTMYLAVPLTILYHSELLKLTEICFNVLKCSYDDERLMLHLAFLGNLNSENTVRRNYAILVEQIVV